jgi:membrane-associated protease RseP (regulator of RpoE activity)
MVNLDMVGRYRAGQFEVVGADSGSTLKETVDRVAAGSGLEYAHTNSGLSASDGFSFYQGKVPTVFLFTGLHDDYHRPSDDWWLLNAEGAAKVARLAAGMARALADADGRPAFREIDPSTMGMGRRARVILGVLFDEKNVGKGAVLQSVTQRSAAARAGLRGGDRVVSFGGREVAGPDDVRAALGLVRPGDTVAVRVVRGDETLDLRVSFPGQPGPVFGVAFAAEDDGKPGAPIQDVAPGSVAEAAGLKAGDRILSFAGKDVAGGSALPSILRATRAGDRVKVRVLRDGKETELEAAFPKDK